MSTALSVFRAIAPEFAATSDADVQAVMDVVAAWLDVRNLGLRYNEALARYAAHMLTMAQRAAGAGGGSGGAAVTPLTGETAGRVSRQYAQPLVGGSAASQGELGLTSHGKAYLDILRSRPRLRMLTTANRSEW